MNNYNVDALIKVKGFINIKNTKMPGPRTGLMNSFCFIQSRFDYEIEDAKSAHNIYEQNLFVCWQPNEFCEEHDDAWTVHGSPPAHQP